jgi:glutamyl-tRNA synthetase
LIVGQVDQWIETSTQLVSGQGFEALCNSLNSYLSLRSFIVGYGTTAADLAIWGQLQGTQQDLCFQLFI